MANNRKTQVVITCNAAVAKKVMEELQQRIDQIKDKMKALDVTTKEGQKEFKKLEKELVTRLLVLLSFKFRQSIEANCMVGLQKTVIA